MRAKLSQRCFIPVTHLGKRRRTCTCVELWHVVSVPFDLLPQGNAFRRPLCRGQAGSHSRSGSDGEERQKGNK